VKVFVIGPGRVGSALAGGLASAGETVLALHGRPPYPPTLADAEVVLVAVPDGAIGEVAQALVDSALLSSRCVVLHTAGALGPTALAPAQRVTLHLGTFHPLQTFPQKDVPPPLQAVPFALAGDAEAMAAGRALAARLGGIPLEVGEGERALYHAAAVLACGHVAALAGAAAQVLARAAGVDAARALHLLAPILAETVRNLEALGYPQALTGPAGRGDSATISRHIEALRAVSPELARLYEALSSFAGKR
jgi:predicted short-subunit dehydrogenase-like oxidoreductase (DUF2520 family)